MLKNTEKLDNDFILYKEKIDLEIKNKKNKFYEFRKPEVYSKILSFLKNTTNPSCLYTTRRLLLFYLIYIIGCDVDILLDFKVFNLKELSKEHKTYIHYKNTYLFIKIHKFDIDDVLDFKPLYYFKKDSDYMFTTISNTKTKLKKSNIILEMQSVLKDINSFANTSFDYKDLINIYTFIN